MSHFIFEYFTNFFTTDHFHFASTHKIIIIQCSLIWYVEWWMVIVCLWHAKTLKKRLGTGQKIGKMSEKTAKKKRGNKSFSLFLWMENTFGATNEIFFIYLQIDFNEFPKSISLSLLLTSIASSSVCHRQSVVAVQLLWYRNGNKQDHFSLIQPSQMLRTHTHPSNDEW